MTCRLISGRIVCSSPRKRRNVMVRRRSGSRKRRVVKGARGYKKCIVATMRRIKFKTPKAARKAFGRAAKSCRKKLAGKTVRRARRKVGRRKGRHCKYGRRKGTKRCRKHPKRR